MKVTGLLYYLNEGHVLQSSTSFMDGGCCVDFARGMKKEVWQLSLRVCPWLNIKRRLKVAGREREKEGVRGWVEKWQYLINLVPYQWNYLLLHVATGNSAARLIPRPASCLPQYSPLNGPWGQAQAPSSKEWTIYAGIRSFFIISPHRRPCWTLLIHISLLMLLIGYPWQPQYIIRSSSECKDRIPESISIIPVVVVAVLVSGL